MAQPDAEPILRLSKVSKTFAGFVAVNGMSLDVRRGSIHALIGPNGAGKTTLFNLATKMLPPSAGEVWFAGRDITRMAPSAVARLGMVRSFQISATFATLTAIENVRVALQVGRRDRYYFWRHADALEELDARALGLLDDVGLGGLRHRRASELPYRQRRALELATTLALDPALLLLDEPTAGMGREDVGRIAALIRRVAKDRTVLMVEPNLAVVADLCDRITVLARGEVLADGPYAQVSTDPAVIAAYTGSDLG